MHDVGIAIRKIKHFRLRAKMTLAGKSRATIGSMNFSSGSFDRRSELAICLNCICGGESRAPRSDRPEFEFLQRVLAPAQFPALVPRW